MRNLILSRFPRLLPIACLLAFFGAVALAAPVKKVNPNPSTTSEVDQSQDQLNMQQFKNLPPADKRGKVHADVICQMPDGSTLKMGDAGYKECMEIQANRVMNQPHSPEAAPYDPRTK